MLVQLGSLCSRVGAGEPAHRRDVHPAIHPHGYGRPAGPPLHSRHPGAARPCARALTGILVAPPVRANNPQRQACWRCVCPTGGHAVCLSNIVVFNRDTLVQYLLERFIEVEAVPKGAPVYQPPEEKQRGVLRLVRSAAGMCKSLTPQYCPPVMQASGCSADGQTWQTCCTLSGLQSAVRRCHCHPS